MAAEAPPAAPAKMLIPSTQGMRDDVLLFAEHFHSQLVTPLIADEKHDVGWGLIKSYVGGARGGTHQRDLYTTAADALHMKRLSEPLGRLQAQFDIGAMTRPFRSILKEMLAQEQRRAGTLRRERQAEAYSPLLSRLESAMQHARAEAGPLLSTGTGSGSSGLTNSPLIRLNQARLHLADLEKTAQRSCQETRRLNHSLRLLATLRHGGHAAHATAVMALMVGVHSLLQLWRRQQEEFNAEVKLCSDFVDGTELPMLMMRSFVDAAREVCASSPPMHSVTKCRQSLEEACTDLGVHPDVAEVVQGIFDVFAAHHTLMQNFEVMFDDRVKILLAYDSIRLTWLRCSEDKPLEEIDLAEEEAQKQAELARQAALAKKKQKKTIKRLEDSLWGQVVQYEIAVKTSDRRGAGTDANVHVILYGADADSGMLPLFVMGDTGDKFERDALDVFIVNSMWVGPLQKIRVGHDAVGFGAGWHLEQIIVHDCLGHTSFFPCGQWLDTGYKKKVQTVRELLPKGKLDKLQTYLDPSIRPPAESLALTTYSIKVFTGNVKGAGTDANVAIMLFGESGYSGPWVLNTPLHDDFERGQIDSFDVEAAYIGQLTAIQIGHDGRGFGADWFLNQVAIFGDYVSEPFIFPCKRWLGGEMGGGDHTAEVLLTCVGVRGTVTAYAINVFTGDKLGAGTDANVKVRLYGTECDSGWIDLEASMTHRDKFESNHTDKFIVDIPFLGEIKKCTVCHDGWGFGAGWYLARIEVQNIISNTSYHFPCHRWLDSGSGDRQIMRDLIERKKGLQHMVPARGLGRAKHLTQYTVTVITGQVKGAGTDANVSITLYGEHGQTGPWRLSTPFRDNFERGHMDKFTLETAWMGELHAARIGHDGKRPNPAWYLETTFVTDELNGGEWEFECRAWLDTKLSQDGKRVKTLVRDLIGNEMESKILSNLSCAAPCQQPGRRSNFSNSSDAIAEQSKQTMRAWLDELNLGRHAGKFEQYDIDPDTHMALTDRHLQEMGINSEDRSRMMAAINESTRSASTRATDGRTHTHKTLAMLSAE